jgi:hypothetical protein
LECFFKVISFSIGYYIIAKTKSSFIFGLSIFTNTLYLVLTYFGYCNFGLLGSGIAFALYYLIHLILVTYIVYKFYKITISKEIFIMICLMLLYGLLSYYVSIKSISIFIPLLFCVAAVGFSIYYLNKKVDLLSFLKKR